MAARTASDGELLIDAAHNPAGAAALASYLQDTGSQKLPIVFAAMADKDLTNMIGALAPVASRVHRDDGAACAGEDGGSAGG